MQLVPLADTAAPAPEHFGCGWFDSSLDLRQGLDITEHARPDAVAEALGLEAWLQLVLQHDRPSHGLVANRQHSCAMIAG